MRYLSYILCFVLVAACGGGGSSPGNNSSGNSASGNASNDNNAGPDDGGNNSDGGSDNGSGDQNGSGVVIGGDVNDIANARYDVNLRRTTMGVPHIKADDFGSIGYGMGYAYAEDNVCVLMEDIVSIRGERARYFGRNGPVYRIFSNGATADPVDNDFFWRHTITDEKIAEYEADQEQDIDDALAGYALGFSRYVRELKAGQHAGRHLACRDEDWLFEISKEDMYRRIIRLGVLASSSVFMEGVANAQPPVGGDSTVSPPAELPFPSPFKASPSKASPEGAGAEETNNGVPDSLEEAFTFFTDEERPFGSNMYGFSDRITANGRPYQFVNPHFPWDGPERLWLMHIMHPEADMHGVALHGAPAVLIGFNDDVAWSHTVSTAFRFTFYELKMVGPTSYQFDAGTRDLEAVDITIDVLEPGGNITQQSRTLYNSHYGPMVIIAAELLDWKANQAFTLRDANIENTRLLKHFFEWNKASSIEGFAQTQRDNIAVPWVNTTAVGSSGDAYYSDQTVVPNVPDDHVAICNAGVSHQAVQALVPGLPVMDGSRSACDWLNDDDAPADGIFGPANLPSQIREDWVTNCNNSYWLTNPDEPIEGFARIIGDERAERSYRTRLCIRQAQELEDLPDEDFTLEKLQETVLSSRILTAENELQAVLDNICTSDSLLVSSGDAQGQTIDISTACTVLTNWSTRNNLDDIGGHIWRQFFRELGDANGSIWNTAYDNADPANTPRGLNTSTPDVTNAFGNAVARLQSRNVDLSAAIRDIQYDFDGAGDRIPIFGGAGTDGSFTIIGFERSVPNDDGYGRATFGNSIVNTVTWNDDGVDAYGFLTYSQSTDPASPFFSNLTQRYSDKDWYRWPFHEDDIEAAKVSELRLQE